MDGMKRISISTPFSVGRVNTYAFTKNGLTVMDPGPATEEAYETLQASLNDIGHRIEAIDRVLITHPHMDHFGQAQRIVDESGADVFAHADAVDRLTDPIEYFKREQRYFRPFLSSMGMPQNTVETVLELPEPYTDYQRPIEAVETVADGETLDIGIELECLATPGHVPGSLCFFAAAEDVLFTGDHVLPNVTPNPLLTLRPGTDDERTRSLPTYIESLGKMLDFESTTGYGGHGDPIADVEARARETISHHQERKEQIAGLIAEHETTTAYRIMREMFPELPATEMFSGMSEVIGHFDMLEDEGRVVIETTDGQTGYTLLQ